MTGLDYVIRDPRILMILSDVDKADFTFLLATSTMGKVHLSSHIGRLKSAGYVESFKSLNEMIPHTEYRLTRSGQKAAKDCLYWLKVIQSAHRCRQAAVYSWIDNHRRLVRMEHLDCIEC